MARKKGSNGKRTKHSRVSKTPRREGGKRVQKQRRTSDVPADSSPRRRDYADEYRRRIARARARGLSVSVGRGHPGKGQLGIRATKREADRQSLLDATGRKVGRDARRVFGYNPSRGKGEAPFIYEDRLTGEAKKEGAFAWTNEHEFIEQITALGLTERDAYTFWFSS
jgi:hypothetical protein